MFHSPLVICVEQWAQVTVSVDINCVEFHLVYNGF